MCYLFIHYVGNQFNFNVSGGINNHNSYLSQNDLFGDFFSANQFIFPILSLEEKVFKNKLHFNVFLF